MTWLAETAMLSFGWRRFLLLLVAGAIAGLSVPPLFIVPALWVAFPILVWCLDGAERRRGWRWLFGPAFRIGFSFGLGYFIVAFHWLGAAFFLEGGVMLVVMPFAILVLASGIAMFWGLGCALAHLFWSEGPWRVVTLAVFLAAAEWARGHFFSGFPFDLVGYALTANDEMMQLASVTGIYGLTLIALLLAMTPALIWPADLRGLPQRLAPFFLSLVFIAAQVGYGTWRIANTPVVEQAGVKLRLVQPLIYEHVDWSRAIPSEVIDKLIMLSETKTNPDDPGLSGVTAVIWPESSLPFFFSEYPEALTRIGRMLPEGVTLLTGSPREEYGEDGAPLANSPGYNALLAIDTNGEVVASYDKSHLVPFGEFLPFQSFFAGLGIKQFVPGANGWAAGDGRRLMTPPGLPAFLALICYESLFSGELGEDIDKAQFILNISNDAWFDGSIGPAQHAHHARVRATEEGIALIRDTNSGLTFSTDPLGRVTSWISDREQALMDVVPAERLATTPFAAVRYWPFWGAELLGLIIAVISSRRRTVRRA